MSETAGGIEKKRSYCAQCGSCCPIICHVKDGVMLKIESDNEHPNTSPLCPKGLAGPELVYNRERLQYPMLRTRPKGDPDPGWQRISWDKAYEIIAAKLIENKARFGAESVAFCRAGSGGSPFTDLSSWVARLSRAFGSPIFVTTTHVCQWHRDSCSNYTYGQAGIGVPEFENAACILVWGHNPQATSRTRVRDIRAGRERGAKLVVIDPRQTQLAEQADVWLQIKPGTDLALALGIINVMLAERLFDEPFCRDWTNGPFLVRSDTGNLLTAADLNNGDPKSYVVWDTGTGQPGIYNTAVKGYETPDILPALEGTYRIKLAGGMEIECRTAFQLLRDAVAACSPSVVESITRVPAETIVKAARLLAGTKPLCYFTYNGIEQHPNASQTNRALCILYSLTGNYDSQGGNVFYPKPLANAIDGLEFVTAEIRQKRLGFKERPLGTSNVGSARAGDLYRAILEGKPYPVKALVGFGGNPVTANAESLTGRKALQALDFYVQVDLFLTPSAELADIVLPASSCYESPGLRVAFRDSARAFSHVQLGSPVVAPRHDSRPDLRIIFELAQKLDLGDEFWNGSLEAAFDYMLAPTGLTRAQLEQNPGGITLNRPPVYRKYSKIDAKTGNPQGVGTPSGKIEIFSQAFRNHGYSPLPAWREPKIKHGTEYPLLLICAKVLPFCHGQHRSIPSLRKMVPEPYLEINPGRAVELGINDGEWVKLGTPHGSVRVKARLTPKIAPDVVCTQHGWWQACPDLDLPGYDPYSAEGSNVNLLYATEPSDPLSGSLLYKGLPCKVSKI